jgi:hypothetical protein
MCSQGTSHHLPRLSGGSDAAEPLINPPSREPAASDAAAKIRSKVRSGALPLSADPPEKCWVGKSTRRRCDGCDDVIPPEQIEYELDLASGRTVRFHANCLAAWQAVRAG